MRTTQQLKDCLCGQPAIKHKLWRGALMGTADNKCEGYEPHDSVPDFDKDPEDIIQEESDQ